MSDTIRPINTLAPATQAAIRDGTPGSGYYGQDLDIERNRVVQIAATNDDDLDQTLRAFFEHHVLMLVDDHDSVVYNDYYAIDTDEPNVDDLIDDLAADYFAIHVDRPDYDKLVEFVRDAFESVTTSAAN